MASEAVFLFSIVVFLTIFPLFPCAESDTSSKSNTTSTVILDTTTQNSTNGTVTPPSEGGIMETITNNKDMLMRAFYVLIGITAIVVVYFGVKAWRLRRKRNKSKKYGLITGRGADYEMAPLDADDDDDDEDTTVFEMNRRKK
ncbi:membrane protein FAM174-like [Ostrea edulis]|uniref:membrane protein FAM174-like n=1 Tax=Ostrea edulis TaxID=37623 RepID=UPI0020949085|nr:membrane protein FAM174-like [Ostrea edulis]